MLEYWEDTHELFCPSDQVRCAMTLWYRLLNSVTRVPHPWFRFFPSIFPCVWVFYLDLTELIVTVEFITSDIYTYLHEGADTKGWHVVPNNRALSEKPFFSLLIQRIFNFKTFVG